MSAKSASAGSVDILTHVRGGAITHEDSLANRHALLAGDVAPPSAYFGIFAITLISNWKPANQVTPTAVAVG